MFRRGAAQQEPKKASYEAQYLGWKECSNTVFDESIFPIVEGIIAKRQAELSFGINSLQITVSKKEFKIVQHLTRQTSRGTKVEKYKFPPIPSCDITCIMQGVPPEIVAIIILGYNASTDRYLHVHVFRFNSADIATQFSSHLNEIIKLPVNQERLKIIEIDLRRKGEIASDIVPRNNSRSRSIDSSTAAHMDSLATELQLKLRPKNSQQNEGDDSGPPILLPPKDYDTISRSQGDSILHHRLIASQRFNAEGEVSDSGVPDADYDNRRDNRTESPASLPPNSRSSPRVYSPQISRSSHSFGVGDQMGVFRKDKRQKLPLRASESLLATSWAHYKADQSK